MPLPSSGPLSLTDIQTEFGGSNPIGLNEYYAGGGLVPSGTTGTNGAVPSSGQIAISNFYGTAAYYTLSKSLRFRQASSTYLNRTPATTTDRKKWTWSGWVKRGNLATGSEQILLRAVDGSANFNIAFTTSDRILVESGPSNLFNSSPVYRDPSAWYHVVVAFDSDNGTADNRCIVYINGVSQVKLNGSVSLGLQVAVNTANPHYTGGNNSDRFYDGYIAELNFIDGQALTPSSFGAANANLGGMWQPAKYTGTYGTNGYYLPFTNTASTTTLVADSSGNGNNWTPNNISLTAGSTYDSMTDVPTLTSTTAANYCTLNPISPLASGSITNANLTFTSGAADAICVGTFGVSSGKWYWEVTATNVNASTSNIGIIGQPPASLTVDLRTPSNGFCYSSSGQKGNNNVLASYGASYTSGDIIGVALDMDAGTLVFYKNNVTQGTAYSSLSGTFSPAVSDGSGAQSGAVFDCNWGQRPFAYTPPTNFLALNAFNL